MAKKIKNLTTAFSSVALFPQLRFFLSCAFSSDRDGTKENTSAYVLKIIGASFLNLHLNITRKDSQNRAQIRTRDIFTTWSFTNCDTRTPEIQLLQIKQAWKVRVDTASQNTRRGEQQSWSQRSESCLPGKWEEERRDSQAATPWEETTRQANPTTGGPMGGRQRTDGVGQAETRDGRKRREEKKAEIL